jgi:hypothetical protein
MVSVKFYYKIANSLAFIGQNDTVQHLRKAEIFRHYQTVVNLPDFPVSFGHPSLPTTLCASLH